MGPHRSAWSSTSPGWRSRWCTTAARPRGRSARLRRWFPAAQLVVFGHSHIPLDQAGDGIRIFNPGSPTDRRRQPQGTIGLLDIEDGVLLGARIIPVS